jgi:NAD(P)-dependent dehydrogenase (short-subunit alcohol dehydrogenase family)
MIVLITGGASGLGESITKAIAQVPEHRVYFTYNNSEVNAKKIAKASSNTSCIKCDFTSEPDISALSKKVEELNIDVLINNAYTGDFLKTHFHKIPEAEFLTDFKANIIPTLIITQAAIACFRKKKKGKLITILTSALESTPPVGSAVYIANKAYLEMLTKVWASENAKFNITSNAISPSFMLTNFTSSMDERIIEQIKEKYPNNELLTTEEVAACVLDLLSSKEGLNGVNIVLDSASGQE